MPEPRFYIVAVVKVRMVQGECVRSVVQIDVSSHRVFSSRSHCIKVPFNACLEQVKGLSECPFHHMP